MNSLFLYGRKGEAHPKAVLTEVAVREAWELKARGMPRAEIAARFGVAVSTIDDVFYRKTWRHVTPEPEADPGR